MYVTADPTAPRGEPKKYYSAAEVERTAGGGHRGATAAVVRRSSARDETIASFKRQYPARLQFVYGAPRYEKPFHVRAIWHDGQFTYIKADATELPALYELKDGKPALVNFQVRARHLRRAEGARPRLPRARRGQVRVLAAGAVTWPTNPTRPSPRLSPTVDPSPRGVLPRGVQTWLMAGLASAMLPSSY